MDEAEYRDKLIRVGKLVQRDPERDTPEAEELLRLATEVEAYELEHFPITERCHCGRPLHYANASMRHYVEAIIAEHGTHVAITIGGRTWLVPRHYLALHGLRGADVDKLGFEEVTG